MSGNKRKTSNCPAVKRQKSNNNSTTGTNNQTLPNIKVSDLPQKYQLIVNAFPHFLPLIYLYWSRSNYPNYSSLSTVLPNSLRDSVDFPLFCSISKFAQQIKLFELKVANEVGIVADGNKRANQKIRKNYAIDQALKLFESNEYLNSVYPTLPHSDNDDTKASTAGISGNHSENDRYVVYPLVKSKSKPTAPHFKQLIDKFNQAVFSYFVQQQNESKEANNSSNAIMEEPQLPRIDLPDVKSPTAEEDLDSYEAQVKGMQLKPQLTQHWRVGYQKLFNQRNSPSNNPESNSSSNLAEISGARGSSVSSDDFAESKEIAIPVLHDVELEVQPSDDGNTAASDSRFPAAYPQYPLLSYFLYHIKQQKFFSSQIAHIFTRPGKVAQLVELDAVAGLEDHTKSILAQYGITEFFAHQKSAIQHLLSQKNVVLATSTNSGKSLVYLTAIINSLVKWQVDVNKENNFPRAFYIAPTKALAQDQLRKFTAFLSLFTVRTYKAAVYDGDTPQSVRKQLKTDCCVLLTNPDMLNASILPCHYEFADFFRALQYIILDEIHLYCGIFGSNVGMILRRLNRIFNYYNAGSGRKLLYVCCSGTIANPKELAQDLAREEFELIDSAQDASAQTTKHFVFWNPPKLRRKKANPNNPEGSNPNAVPSNVDAGNAHQHFNNPTVRLRYLQYHSYYDLQQLHKRRSPFVETSILTANLIQMNIKTLIFGKVRKVIEVLYQNTLKVLSSTETTKPLCQLVRSYRGGYNASDRREIESKLFRDELLAVIATSALEIGIDLGALDCTVHLGFHGSASFWQQCGRSGRNNTSRTTNTNGHPTEANEALCLYVAFDSPFDQFLIHNPQRLLDSMAQSVFINLNNLTILAKHIRRSIEELPIRNEHHDITEIEQLFNVTREYLEEVMSSSAELDYGEDAVEGLSNIQVESSLQQQLIFTDSTVYSIQSGANRIQAESSEESAQSNYFNIRSINPTGDFDIINQSNGHIIDFISGRKILFECHVGATYLNQGQTFLVQYCDFNKKQVQVKPITNPYYYTKCRDTTNVVVIQQQKAFISPPSEQKAVVIDLINNSDSSAVDSAYQLADHIYYGRVQVDTLVFGYHKILVSSGEIVDTLPLTLPHIRYESNACWVELPNIYRTEIKFAEQRVEGMEMEMEMDLWAGIHGINHCLINLLPYYLAFNASSSNSDFGTDCPSVYEKNYDLRTSRPINIIIYERNSLLGITQSISLLFPALLQAVANIINQCECEDIRGCPSCIQSSTCTELNQVMDKRAAKWILSKLLNLQQSKRDQHATVNSDQIVQQQ
jgi:DEAD/DEAH box helicase domain-containing protein